MTAKLASHQTYATVFSLAYLALVTNLLLVLTCLPLVLLLALTDPVRTWPLIAVVAPLCAPALAGAFAVFRAHADGEDRVVRAFVRGWRDSAWPAVRFAAVVSVALVILLCDIHVLAGTTAGVLLVPVLAVLSTVTAAACLVGLVALGEEPRARLRDVAKIATYLAVRRWYLSLFGLAALAIQLAVLSVMPAIALGLTTAPVLYVVWANSRFILRPPPASAAA